MILPYYKFNGAVYLSLIATVNKSPQNCTRSYLQFGGQKYKVDPTELKVKVLAAPCTFLEALKGAVFCSFPAFRGNPPDAAQVTATFRANRSLWKLFMLIPLTHLLLLPRVKGPVIIMGTPGLPRLMLYFKVS